MIDKREHGEWTPSWIIGVSSVNRQNGVHGDIHLWGMVAITSRMSKSLWRGYKWVYLCVLKSKKNSKMKLISIKRRGMKSDGC